MFRKLYWVLIVLILASAFCAGSGFSADRPKSTFQFQGLRFGQPPIDDMICTKGIAAVEQRGRVVRSIRSIISRLKKIKDITHFNRVEISAPNYDFWQDQLFRVRFEVLCEPGNAELCMDSVYNGLDDQYGLRFLDGISSQLSEQDEINVEFYLTDSGDIVEFDKNLRRGKLQLYVKIYNKDLIDTVRLAANPKYVPVEIDN